MKNTLMTAFVISLIAGASMADTRPERPSREMMEQAANSMGVNEQEMESCMKAQHKGGPPKGGEAPSAEMQRQIEDNLYSCLKGKNHNLDRGTFDNAMAKLPKPGRPKQ